MTRPKVLFSLITVFTLCAAALLPACAQQSNSSISKNAQFFEAEDFATAGGGWKVQKSKIVRRASGLTVLSGSSGKKDGVATQKVDIPKAGSWRIFVRYMVYSRYRGPFVVSVLQGRKTVASHVFGLTPPKGARSWSFVWDSFDVNLQPGQYTLQLGKYKHENSSGYTRKVDCFLLTTDKTFKPSITPYGPQTWMKVTLGQGYTSPLQVHMFADHFRSPWYAHYALTKGHFDSGVRPTKEHMKDKLSNGESTGWLNISQTIYQDSGARLAVYPAYSYWNHAKTFNATIQFAPKPSDAAVVKTFNLHYSPSTFYVIIPPNLNSKANIAKLQSDMDLAQHYGKLADNFDWPKAGKKAVQFPLFISAKLNAQSTDKKVLQRELKTLSPFGFNGLGSDPYFDQYGYTHKHIGNVGWYYKSTFSAPEKERISKKADAVYQAQIKNGLKASDITYAMVMDEPTGQPLSRIAKDKASNDAFQTWLKSMNLSPAVLLVSSWDDVKLVTGKDKDKFPALYYYSEKFRTVALGQFIALQKKELQDHWKSTFPVVANFSDGATYYANFYGQGVDYFTLLHDTDQNAIWSEDWANNSSTYQDASYNVELMRAAARRKGQKLGQYLIAYAGRKGYDIRLKAVSEIARGVKMMLNYAYGPPWAGHDRSAWEQNTAIWSDVAKVNHEIGAAEDLLLPAMPQKAKVAIIYSSASDIWNQQNTSYGFERMNTWLALTHAQIPVDVMGEGDVAAGDLAGYKVCYLADPNLTRAAAAKLAQWVKAGGTLIMTAGAGERDQYNRPLKILNQLLPYQRNAAQTLQKYRNAGKFLYALKPQGTVKTSDGKVNVLSVRQTFANVKNAMVKNTFADGSPAELESQSGKGRVICKGYLPALDYIRQAVIAKGDIRKKAQKIDDNNGIPGPDDAEPLALNKKSYNPWQYPANIRDLITAPVKAAQVQVPIKCSVPLVDAVYMPSKKGIVIPLANYTLKPIKQMTLKITVNRPIHEVSSVYQGKLHYQKLGNHKIRLTMPLDCTDFVMIR